MDEMNVGILGTRGIPNYYGGFEQFAQYLAKGLVERGYNVTVYNSSSHPYQLNEWNGVRIVHCNDPENKLGTVGQFLYDLNCIRDARKRNFDIILQLGYTSSSVWGWLLPRKNCVVTTNMDGLEWKRSKYSPLVRTFLKWAETLATKYSDYWISDSIGIQEYLQKEYQLPSIYIPYGTETFESPDSTFLQQYNVKPFEYYILIARLESENNIDMILEGFINAGLEEPFLVIGNHQTPFGEYLKNKYASYKSIKFCGANYDLTILNNLRYYSKLYFHGHSVGGTNPSLLEAMGSQALICAHDNIFNKAILKEDAFYFSTANEIAELLKCNGRAVLPLAVQNNLEKAKVTYSWDNIIKQYIAHFESIKR
jgi:glycosyltransferase involved in cell wall biosynthesis